MEKNTAVSLASSPCSIPTVNVMKHGVLVLSEMVLRRESQFYSFIGFGECQMFPFMSNRRPASLHDEAMLNSLLSSSSIYFFDLWCSLNTCTMRKLLEHRVSCISIWLHLIHEICTTIITF